MTDATEDTDHTIGEAARYLNISIRTLHHWDDIHLLSPQWRTNTNYRLYTPEDIKRGQLILMYREAGMPLHNIRSILDNPGENIHTHLTRQKQLLKQKLTNIHAMINAVDHLLTLEENTVTTEKIQEILGPDWKPEYQEEAEQRWGDTPEWHQAQATQKTMSADDWTAAKREHQQLAEKLDEAVRGGVEPGSEAANALAEQHKTTVDRWYPCTYNQQVCLARMYEQDERFAATYHHHTTYLRQIIEANAHAHGVDLENVTWG